MAIDEKSSWNEKYSEGSHTSLEPDPFLVSAYEGFLVGNRPGAALDVAGGVGRHAIWLAQRGWRVKLVDVSEVGVKQAEENAKQTGTASSITTQVRDLNTNQDLGREQYDLVVVFILFAARTLPCLGCGHQARRTSGLQDIHHGTAASCRWPQPSHVPAGAQRTVARFFTVACAALSRNHFAKRLGGTHSAEIAASSQL